MKDTIVPEIIEQKIFVIRGHKVMMDAQLAGLYAVPAKALNQAVKRNIERFPQDFMFQLTWEEAKSLRSHLVTLENDVKSSPRGKHIKYRPYVFTEQGVAMLSSVLRSKRAVQVNIAIMRAFVKLREMLSAHKELAVKLNELERKTEKHDTQIHAIFEAIRQLMSPPPEAPKGKMGFHP